MTAIVAQGGDWGALIVEMMGVQAPPELLGDPHQHASRNPAGDRQALRVSKGPAAGRSRRGGTRRLRPAVTLLLHEGARLRERDGEPAADPVRARGFADRPRRLVPRPRHLDLPGRSRACSTASKGLTPRRHPRQHHALLADQHGSVFGAALLGEQCRFFAPSGVNIPVGGKRLPRGDLPDPEEVGGDRRTQAASTTEASEGRRISPPGSSRKRFVEDLRAGSVRCAESGPRTAP